MSHQPQRATTHPPEPDCPRLSAELDVLNAMRHTTDEDREQRTRDHQRWHPCPNDWTTPSLTPRDPERKP